MANSEKAREAEIRENIEQTRAQMSEALDALQAKMRPQAIANQAQTLARDMTQGALGAMREHLNPHEIADQVTGVVRDVTSRSMTTMVNNAQDAAKNAGSSLLERIRQNPVPVALIGLGLGLLLAQDPLRRAQGQVAQITQQAQGAAGQLAERAQDTAGQLAGQLAERAQDATGQVVGQARTQVEQLGAQAQQQAAQAGSWLQETLKENPLAVGATALAIGAIVGLMIPETPQEHQLMGKTRDALVEQVQTTASETLHKAQHVAEEAQAAAQAAAQRAAREEGLLPS
ncbi:MAG TPA: DUF3618 domain-containing protein [Ktedonobacterales bacterium]|nr:DUF3618 domain-containing protein [Ktedonobacterales bacterium]